MGTPAAHMGYTPTWRAVWLRL